MAIAPDEAGTWDPGHAHNRALLAALEWAEIADVEHHQALKQVTDAEDHQAFDQDDYPRDTVTEARQQAQVHGVRSADARRLAEMWATVAGALATRPPTRGATIVHIGATDPKATDAAIRDQLRDLKRRGGNTV